MKKLICYFSSHTNGLHEAFCLKEEMTSNRIIKIEHNLNAQFYSELILRNFK
jgi:hypothetical protein